MFIFLLLCASASAAHLEQQMVDMTFSFNEVSNIYPGIKFGSNATHKHKQWFQFKDLTVGTYIDSPALFSEGHTVDQLPLPRLIAPVAIVDLTATVKLDADAEATVEDFLYWEALTGQTLNETILLLKTGWGKKWNDQAAFFGMDANDDGTKLHYPGLSPEAAKWLVDNRNVYGVGVETPHVDKGASNPKEVQKMLLKHGVFTIQNIANMDKIPIYGATLNVIPMKIDKASSAPVRVFAVYPVVLFEYIPSVSSDKSF